MAVDPFALNLRHLRAVASIAATGSVSAAAERVSLSQPALTQGIAKLEAQIDAPLFERRSNGMVATQEGRLLAERADETMAHLAQALRPIRRSGAGFAQAERLVTATQVRALLALADAGSFVSAAAQTALSQPALHRAVRDVERLAGVPLVERRGRGVALTEAGRKVARGFRLAIGAIASGLADLGALSGGPAGLSIAVGAMPLARARLLPEAMARLHHSDPAAGMLVVEGAHRELIDLLREGRIDMTIGALRDPPPGPDVVQRPLLTDRLAIVARADHPLIVEGRTDAAALAAFPWIVGGRTTPLHAQWARLFAGVAPPPTPIECGSVMTIRGLLLAGDYLTLLSPDQVWVEIEHGLLTILGPPLEHSVRTIGITTRADWRPTAIQRRFVALVEDVAAKGLQENQ